MKTEHFLVCVHDISIELFLYVQTHLKKNSDFSPKRHQLVNSPAFSHKNCPGDVTESMQMFPNHYPSSFPRTFLSG